jgi:hypothetical protein
MRWTKSKKLRPEQRKRSAVTTKIVSDSTEAKRQMLIAKYKGDKWKRKVTKMTDDQVVAIFLRLRQDNKI